MLVAGNEVVDLRRVSERYEIVVVGVWGKPRASPRTRGRQAAFSRSLFLAADGSGHQRSAFNPSAPS